ncbi:MAG: threonine/serine exporter family protein [Propionibacteriaceae bacterium]|nr:threonine/serine exporter family protein [Propionibacteriaceae bacterium]
MSGRLDRLLRRQRVAGGASGSGVEGPGADVVALVALATRIGGTALECGASAAEATQMIIRVGLAHGVGLQADVTYTSLTVGSYAGEGEQPVTMVRVVPALAQDYARLGHLEGVVEAVSRGEITLDEATDALRERESSGQEYRRWVRWLAAFAQGASICALLGGIWMEVVVAGLATLLIGWVTALMVRRRAPYFFVQVVAGAVPMLLAVALMYLRGLGVTDLWQLSPSLVVAAGMVSMLAGMGVVAAAQDALDGYFVTAGARIIELVMRTGGLILGVAAVLWLGVRVGAPAYLAPELIPAPHPVVQVLACAAFATAFGVTSGLGPRGAVMVGGFGALAWTSYLLVLTPLAGDHVLAAGAAAFVVGVLGHRLSRWLGPPAVALVTMGIAPLMPGMLVYRGLFRLVVGLPAVTPNDTAPELFMLAVLTGVGLALGSSAGAVLGRRLALPTEHIARRATMLSMRAGQMRRR